MGTGSSPMGKGGGGGAPLTPPSTEDVKRGNILPAGGVPFADVMNMTDDEKASVVDDALNSGVPLFLEDSGMQRFAYFTGMTEKPTVVSDSQLDSINGTEMYRTVNDAYNRNIDIGYTSNDIAKQISEGDFTMYSDSGGSAHGKGIYFAESYSDSSWYGNSRQNPVTMRAKVTGKTIRESQLTNDYNAALRRGDKLATACSKAPGGSMDKRNLYGLVKGYDVISPDYGNYHVVLNRKGITVSSTIKRTNIGGTKW